jgi:hypothetical protein
MKGSSWQATCEGSNADPLRTVRASWGPKKGGMILRNAVTRGLATRHSSGLGHLMSEQVRVSPLEEWSDERS